MGKFLVVVVVLAGLLPVVWLASAGLFLLWMQQRMIDYFGEDPDGSSGVYFHDSSLGIWGINVGVNPQWWSVGLLVAGVVMILLGMVGILWPQGRG